MQMENEHGKGGAADAIQKMLENGTENGMEDVQDVTEAGTEASGSAADAVPSPVEAVTDISGTVAVLFVLAMIFGLMVFDMFSKKWHT